MKNSSFLFFTILSILFLFQPALKAENVTSEKEKKALMINIFAQNNGKGLENGRIILRKALEDLGHVVFERERHIDSDENSIPVDLNIFFETINRSSLSLANDNWFIPNPEFCYESQETLNQIDLVVCRTHDAERIFRELGKKIFYLGFTSRDCFIDKHKV